MPTILRPSRALVRFSGADAQKLLFDVVTGRLVAEAGPPEWWALLSPQGKIQAEGLSDWHDDAFWLDVDRSVADAFIKRMKMYRLRAAVEANVSAGRELSALTPDPPAGTPLPKWRIVAPDPAEQLLPLYKAAGAAAGGVPWEYLAAIHLVETRMGRIKGDSTAGAQGPMQFIPTTWAIYGNGGDITSNRDAIYAAARYLRATGAPSDMARALRAYNNSARYVRAITAYAQQMQADERAYLGYHAWQVYYGTRLLPEGTVVE